MAHRRLRSKASRLRAWNQCRRIGDEVKLSRATLGMSLQQVADRAGVSWSTAARAQAGDPTIALGTLCAVTEAVGLDLVLHAYPGRQPTLRDTGQLSLVEHVCQEARGSWQPTVEAGVGEHGRAIDLVLFGPREILACEIERVAIDFQAQFRRADLKRRELAASHQRPVRLVMVVEDTRRNRSAIQGHADVIRAGLPAGPREVLRALRSGGVLGRDGLLWVRRRRWPRRGHDVSREGRSRAS
jgi:transcriptional regulator with XRE-family HTH domain